MCIKVHSCQCLVLGLYQSQSLKCQLCSLQCNQRLCNMLLVALLWLSALLLTWRHALQASPTAVQRQLSEATVVVGLNSGISCSREGGGLVGWLCSPEDTGNEERGPWKKHPPHSLSASPSPYLCLCLCCLLILVCREMAADQSLTYQQQWSVWRTSHALRYE